MKENQLIPLYRIIDSKPEMAALYEEYKRLFESYEEFMDFCKMQVKFYPTGITRMVFLENATNYSINSTILSLKNKLQNGLIKEHTSDDGTTYYSLGE
jgi:hypothetical protein